MTDGAQGSCQKLVGRRTEAQPSPSFRRRPRSWHCAFRGISPSEPSTTATGAAQGAQKHHGRAPKELRSITAALPRSSEASRPPRRHGRRTSFLRCCNNWPWARWLQTARLPSHPALGVGSLKSEVLDQNHILAPGLQSPLPPFSPNPTSQRPACSPAVAPLLLLGHHHPHLPPEDTSGVSGARVDDPGSSPSQSPAMTLPIRGQLQAPGTCTSSGLRLSCQVRQSSPGPLFPRTRKAWTLQERGIGCREAGGPGSLNHRPEGETWVWRALRVRGGSGNGPT